MKERPAKPSSKCARIKKPVKMGVKRNSEVSTISNNMKIKSIIFLIFSLNFRKNRRWTTATKRTLFELLLHLHDHMKNVIDPLVYLGQWPSIRSFGFNI